MLPVKAANSRANDPQNPNCVGENISPQLSWIDPPAGTKSFAFLMIDPEWRGGGVNHWVAYGIPADVTVQLPQERGERTEYAPLESITGRTVVLQRTLSGVVALTATLCLTIAVARAWDDTNYPDINGQWVRAHPRSQWDPSRPRGLGQQAPLTPEYQAIFEANLAALHEKAHVRAGRESNAILLGAYAATEDLWAQPTLLLAGA
jgi:hypothetical protein